MNKKVNISLLRKIHNKRYKVAIIGLGYVGLPLVKRFINSSKIDVIGVDNDIRKVNLLRKGISPIDLIKIQYFKKFKDRVSDNYSIVNSADIIICLPTPLKLNKPDLVYLDNCYKNLSKITLENKMIILELIVYPGVTRSYANKIIKLSSKLKIGKNIFFGYSPERENPGDKNFSYNKTPKVIAGYSKPYLKLIKKIYQNIVTKIYSATH